MPSLTYISAFTRTDATGGSRGEADATTNINADAMQKVCETIGLFNAEYLQMSDIPINTHTHTHTQLALLAQTTLLKCAGTRVNIRLFLQ